MATITPDPDRPGGYLLRESIVVAKPLDEVFAFFSDAHNLQRLTPPDMGFRVLTPGELEMRVGLLIDYRIWSFGLPMRWRSEITRWEPGVCFTDIQRKGPFRYWEHTHTFEPLEGEGGAAVRVSDEVHYGVPGGSLVHRWMVKPLNERVFAYRVQKLESLLGPWRPD